MIRTAELFNIGDIVRKLRIRAGIRGATAIKKRLGINKATLSRIENTSKFDKETIEKIAPKLGTTMAEILAMRDELKNPQRSILGYPSCPDNNPDHIFYQRLLEEVLHGDQIIAKLAIVGLEALVARSRDGPSDKSDKLSRMKLAGNQ